MIVEESPRAKTALSEWREKMENFLVERVLPVGLFALVSGLLWIGDHGYYSKLFYWLMALPTIVLVALRPACVGVVLRSPIAVTYLAFAVYISISVTWSAASDAPDLLKRPLFVAVLFLAILRLARERFELVIDSMKWSAMVAAVAALVTLTLYLQAGGAGRLTGYGAVHNPLLVSHVFGFFAALWLAFYVTDPRPFHWLSLVSMGLCSALVVATGSRTPLVALVAAVGWLAIAARNRKSAALVATFVLLGVLTVAVAPDLITQRGLSYRNEIWAGTLAQISEKPWFGHGYGSSFSIQLADFSYPFSDPHNLLLSVLYSGGAVGFLLWVCMYAVAFVSGWRLRSDKWVKIAATTVVYGLAAGMTEGGSFLSRPKEHWLLIWVPLALLSAATVKARADG